MSYTGSYNTVISISSPTGTISISSFDPAVKVVKIHGVIRTDYTGSIIDSIQLRCNGGSTGDYLWQEGYFTGTDPSAASGIPDSSIQIWTVPCDGGYNDSRMFGIAELLLLKYNSTDDFKSFSGNSYVAYPSYQFVNSGVWRSTDAITSITLVSASGSNFSIGTELYVVHIY